MADIQSVYTSAKEWADRGDPAAKGVISKMIAEFGKEFLEDGKLEGFHKKLTDAMAGKDEWDLSSGTDTWKSAVNGYTGIGNKYTPEGNPLWNEVFALEGDETEGKITMDEIRNTWNSPGDWKSMKGLLDMMGVPELYKEIEDEKRSEVQTNTLASAKQEVNNQAGSANFTHRLNGGHPASTNMFGSNDFSEYVQGVMRGEAGSMVDYMANYHSQISSTGYLRNLNPEFRATYYQDVAHMISVANASLDGIYNQAELARADKDKNPVELAEIEKAQENLEVFRNNLDNIYAERKGY